MEAVNKNNIYNGSFGVTAVKESKNKKQNALKDNAQKTQSLENDRFPRIPASAYTHLAFKAQQFNKVKDNICFGSSVNIAKDLSYNAFVRFLSEIYPDLATKNIDETVGKLLKKVITPENKGHYGGRNITYHIPETEKFLIRRRIGSNQLEGKLQHPEEILYPELNLGQVIAKIGDDIEVMRKVEGEPIGLSMSLRDKVRSDVSNNYVSPVDMLWKEVKFYGQDEMLEKLDQLSNVPQYAFNNLAKTIKYISQDGKGHIFDIGDANNIHLYNDKTTGKYKFNILDDLFAINKNKDYPKEIPSNGSIEDMAFAMIRSNGSSIYPSYGFTKFEHEIAKYNKSILEKCILAGLKEDLPLPANDEQISILFNLSNVDSSVWQEIRGNWDNLKLKVQAGENIKLFD